MGRIQIALLMAAVMAVACLVPLAASDADAGASEDQFRVSNKYLLYSEADWSSKLDYTYMFLASDEMSDGEKRLLAYAEDHSVDLSGLTDDSGVASKGDAVRLYLFNANVPTKGSTSGQKWSVLSMPYHQSYYAEAGSVFTIDADAKVTVMFNKVYSDGVGNYRTDVSPGPSSFDMSCSGFVTVHQASGTDPYTDVKAKIGGTSDLPTGMSFKRISSYYVGKAEITYSAGTAFTGNPLVFKSGSENHQRFVEYLGNPSGSSLQVGFDRYLVAPDDYAAVRDGDRVVLYNASASPIMVGGYVGTDGKSQMVVFDIVSEPDSITAFVKAGDTLKGTFISEDVLTLDDSRGSTMLSGKEVSVTMKTSTSVKVTGQAFTSDVWYEMSGGSEPNGSMALYVGLCAAVAIFVMALMLVAGRGPGWAK